MNKVFIFDVDGTLTPSRRPMTSQFENFFFKWANKNIFYLVSGSDLEKIKEQVPEHILELAEGVFTCGGNKFYKTHRTGDILEYEKTFKPSNTLLTYLGEQIRMSDYPVKTGNHIEDRGSMVNFSMVGRNCSLQERKDYFEYDELTGERQDIAKYIRDTWKDLDAVIGGQISIDIAPKGNDKSQILKRIQNDKPNYDYIFVGDRTMEGGNDYPLAKLMNESSNCKVYQAGEPSQEDGWKETMKILKK